MLTELQHTDLTMSDSSSKSSMFAGRELIAAAPLLVAISTSSVAARAATLRTGYKKGQTIAMRYGHWRCCILLAAAISAYLQWCRFANSASWLPHTALPPNAGPAELHIGCTFCTATFNSAQGAPVMLISAIFPADACSSCNDEVAVVWDIGNRF